MGFFDLKAICSVCNNEVGLNRFKVKQSNAWICPECLKKAGFSNINLSKMTIEEIKEIIEGESHQKSTCSVCNNEVELTKFKIEQSNALICLECVKKVGFANDISKMTIEEIKEIIEEKQYNLEERNALIERNPLATAEGMYKYCLNNKLGSGFNEKWGVKHFKVIEKNLLSNEEVKMAFIGIHNYISATNHNGHFAYAITNKRMIMGQKKQISGENFQSVSLDYINDITFTSGVFSGTLTIDTIKEVFNVNVDKDSARSINSMIHNVIDELKNITITSKSKNMHINNVSIADELKKYKELLDLGVLTQDEFELQKNKLLNI
ncbi:hypothetical protein GCM10008904_02360 [Paraclostridium ghonii]|uniref:DNA-binding transcriptional MerR regulator n=1 Tax=Paraclostridium ghonii TaxID=29358 RepID=A0ABU0N116_9FIRM|nr:DUF4428 domain-containing protein [Paeniclostridium ghonii]MDQ0556862.1 DNA-binding transcriptional MerR regulator [Paeniclostridium ghonii]